MLVCVSASSSAPWPGTTNVQLPVMLPTTNVRVSLAVAPLLSLTVTFATPLKPFEKMTVPLVPLNGFPATSHAYVIESPSGSDAAALNENCVSCAMPNAGAKFIDVMVGARFAGGVGVLGDVGVDGVLDDDDPPDPPPQAAARDKRTTQANANCLRIGPPKG